MELKDFLKTQSNIPKKFIDDFYDIKIKNNVNTDFKIDLDTVAEWLGSTSKSLKRTLVRTYEKDKDYVVKKDNKQKKYYLTSPTFMRLCMLSNTPKADEVRRFFLELEKLVLKYSDSIIKHMKERIIDLEDN